MRFTDRDRQTLNNAKAIAILSVIAAHVVPLVDTDPLSTIASSVWNLFGEVGVIVFFFIGGFLYSRKDGDNTVFWKKKALRLLIPWLFCSLLTYLLTVILSHSISMTAYIKWVLGSGTWYYYATVYALFLFIFKWFYKRKVVLFALIVIQTIVLALKTIGFSTTIPFGFFTDYLNPLHWVGYFSTGIILKKYRPDVILNPPKALVIISAAVSISSGFLLYNRGIYTSFNIFSSIFCVSSAVLILFVSHRVAQFKAFSYIGKIGEYTLCIYLLHMQIAQGCISRIPDCSAKIILSPFIGLFLMLLLIETGLLICRKIPFDDKIKMLVGL